MRTNPFEPGQWNSANTATERHRRSRHGVGLVTLLGIMCLILVMAIRPAHADQKDAVQPNHQDIDIKIGQMLMIGFRGLTADAHSSIMEDIAPRAIIIPPPVGLCHYCASKLNIVQVIVECAITPSETTFTIVTDSLFQIVSAKSQSTSLTGNSGSYERVPVIL